MGKQNIQLYRKFDPLTSGNSGYSDCVAWKPPFSPFCGRDADIERLSALLVRARSGVGSVVLVEGGAGMGKSRLLHEFAEMASQQKFRVGTSTADPDDSMVELATLTEALFEGTDPILGPAMLRREDARPERRFGLLEEIQSLLEGTALKAPLVIALDDVQWTDGGTAAGLRTIPIRLAAVPIVWVIAFRPAFNNAPLERALQHIEKSGAERISLGPLDEDAIRKLGTGVLGAEPNDAVLEMAHRAGGSPFLLVELFSGLRAEGLTRVESGFAELIDARLPHRVGESMRRRLDRMSESARQVAVVATSLGQEFSTDGLAAMLEQPASALLGPVDELLRTDIFIENDAKLTFRHDLIREAVRASLPLSVAQALDRQAAGVLLAGGALPVEVATRLAESARPGDEVAITTLSKAAEALGMIDPGAAAELNERALDIAPHEHPMRGALVAQTAIWLHAAGSGEKARTFADTGLREILPPEEEAGVRLTIAAMFSISPDVRAESCRKGLALPDVSDFVRSLLLANLFHNLVTAGHLDEARRNFRRRERRFKILITYAVALCWSLPIAG